MAFEWVISEKGFFENIVGYVRDFLFEGSYLTIWFLNALAISFIIMACLLRKFSARCCFVISLPLYLCALLLSSYHEVLVKFPLGEFISNAYYSVFSSTKNGVLFAFPFVSMGYYLGTAENAKLKKSQYGALAVLLYLGLNVEVFLRESFYGNERSVDFAVMLVPLIWVLVRILSEIEIKDLFVKNKSAFVFLRKMSVLIFLTQRLFIFTFDTIEVVIYKYYGKEIFEQLPTARFLLISGSVSLFSYMVIKLSERYNWVKKIC